MWQNETESRKRGTRQTFWIRILQQKRAVVLQRFEYAVRCVYQMQRSNTPSVRFIVFLFRFFRRHRRLWKCDSAPPSSKNEKCKNAVIDKNKMVKSCLCAMAHLQRHTAIKQGICEHKHKARCFIQSWGIFCEDAKLDMTMHLPLVRPLLHFIVQSLHGHISILPHFLNRGLPACFQFPSVWKQTKRKEH